MGESGGGIFNGEKRVLYYADALTEIAFVVPSLSDSSGKHLQKPEAALRIKPNDQSFCAVKTVGARQDMSVLLGLYEGCTESNTKTSILSSFIDTGCSDGSSSIKSLHHKQCICVIVEPIYL